MQQKHSTGGGSSRRSGVDYFVMRTAICIEGYAPGGGRLAGSVVSLNAGEAQKAAAAAEDQRASDHATHAAICVEGEAPWGGRLAGSVISLHAGEAQKAAAAAAAAED
jgi:hypothetical protein